MVEKPKKKSRSYQNSTSQSKIKRAIIYLFVFLVVIGSIFTIFIIDAGSTSEDRNAWKINFVIILAQDLFFTPFLSLTLQLFFLRLARSRTLERKVPRVMKFVKSKLLNEKLFFLNPEAAKGSKMKLEKISRIRMQRSSRKLSSNIPMIDSSTVIRPHIQTVQPNEKI